MFSSRFGEVYEGYKPYMAMLLVQAIYSGMALFSKASVSAGMNPFIFVVYRQAFATAALAPVAFFVERKPAPRMSYALLWKTFFASLIGITMSLNLFYFAIQHTSATYASATTNLIPSITFVIALVMGIERMFIHEWHGWAKVMGSVASVSGALVFAFVKGPSLNLMGWFPSNHHSGPSPTDQFGSSGEFVKGPLTILCANTLWSCWGIMQAPIVREYPAKLWLITLQCFFGLVQSTVWAVAMERKLSSWKLGWDFNLISVAYCGVIVTAFTYWLQLWSIEKRGPVFTSMFTPLALIITAIFSAFLWKETLYFGSVCGAVLLAGGLYCVLWGKSKEIDSMIGEQECQETKEDVTLEAIKTQP